MNNQNEPNVKEEVEETKLVDEKPDSIIEEDKLVEEQPDTNNEETKVDEGQPEIVEKEDELKEHQEIENKKLKKTFIKILIYFLLSSLIYVICKAYDPFSNVNTSAEIQSVNLLKYISIVMYISFVISGLLLLSFILYTCGIKLNIKTHVLKIAIEILDWFAILPICIAVTSICFTFLFTFTIVDGESMEPTLYDGEQLLLTYDKDFERFDIIVCEVPSGNQSVLYVKRIIGMPGEIVEFKFNTTNSQHDLYINGKLVEQPFYETSEKLFRITNQTDTAGSMFSWAEFCFMFRHQLVVDENGNLVIPEGCYFVLGDNRRNSRDSRTIGLIKEEDILGQINYRLHSIFKYEKLV